jgi:DNA-binding transcriptional LysR family regulator
MLEKLEYIIALAREKNFARAAESCGVTQPTLSQGIQKLEEALKTRLVQRSSRFQGFTPEGERVLVWARRIVGDTHAMRQEIFGLHNGVGSHLRIAAIPAAMPIDDARRRARTQRSSHLGADRRPSALPDDSRLATSPNRRRRDENGGTGIDSACGNRFSLWTHFARANRALGERHPKVDARPSAYFKVAMCNPDRRADDFTYDRARRVRPLSGFPRSEFAFEDGAAHRRSRSRKNCVIDFVCCGICSRTVLHCSKEFPL